LENVGPLDEEAGEDISSGIQVDHTESMKIPGDSTEQADFGKFRI
jgi:hypothetical protein